MNYRPLRFDPDLLNYALIDLESAESEEFSPKFVALIDNESYAGCSLVVLNKEKNLNYKVGQVIRVQVGNLDPMLSKIAWVKPIEDQIVKIGIQYLK